MSDDDQVHFIDEDHDEEQTMISSTFAEPLNTTDDMFESITYITQVDENKDDNEIEKNEDAKKEEDSNDEAEEENNNDENEEQEDNNEENEDENHEESVDENDGREDNNKENEDENHEESVDEKAEQGDDNEENEDTDDDDDEKVENNDDEDENDNSEEENNDEKKEDEEEEDKTVDEKQENTPNPEIKSTIDDKKNIIVEQHELPVVANINTEVNDDVYTNISQVREQKLIESKRILENKNATRINCLGTYDKIELENVIIANTNLISFNIYNLAGKNIAKQVLTIKTPTMVIPFGAEKMSSVYNLDLLLDNSQRDFFKQMLQIDKFFSNITEMNLLTALSNYLQTMVLSKLYCQSVKVRKDLCVLRTKANNTTVIEDTKKNKISVSDITPGSHGKFILELVSLWDHASQYGIVWSIKKAKIKINKAHL